MEKDLESLAKKLNLNALLDRDRVFHVGEEIIIKGSRFGITNINERGDMKLKLLPKQE